jgi:hypothetical protein
LAMDTLNLEGLQPIEITQNRQRKCLEKLGAKQPRFGKAWRKSLELAEHPSDVGPHFAKIEAQRARLRRPDAGRLLSDLPREPGLTLGINYIR